MSDRDHDDPHSTATAQNPGGSRDSGDAGDAGGHSGHGDTSDHSDPAKPGAPADTTPQRSLFGYPLILPDPHDVRLRLAVVTTSLHVLGQVAFNFNLSIAQILVSLAAAATVEFTVTFVRRRQIVWPASALLTGNSVALILRSPGTEHGDWWSLRGWQIFAATSALAILSKYLIRWKGQHIFNPSNFLLVLVFLALGQQRADPQILWWGPWSLGLVLGFAVILAGSVAVTMQVGQMRTALAFWVPFTGLISIITLSGHAITTNWHVGPLTGWSYWLTLVVSPEVLVFLFYMITDPKASPRTREGKVIFGFAIALASALFVSTQTGEFGTKVGILAGLVVVCPFVPLIDARVEALLPPTDLRRTSGVGSATGRRIVAPRFTVPGRVLGRTVAIATSALLITGGVVFALGSQESSDLVAAPGLAALGRRSEVATEQASLPKVTLDGAAARSAFRLTPEAAAHITADTVLDLQLEARAFAHLDGRLLSAGLAGTRLTTMERAVRELAKTPTAPRPVEITYTFSSASVTVFKADGGPQTPPELAVRLKGEATGVKGSVPFDQWFVLTRVEDVYLVSGAFDSDRRPVDPAPLDSRLTGINPPSAKGDTPVADDLQPASPTELAGLSFTDRATEMGLSLPHSRYGLSEGQDFKIGGAAVADIDSDDLPDVLLTRVGYPDVLFHNDGGSFTDITVAAGLSPVATDTARSGGSTAAVFADLNGDGHPDLIKLGTSMSGNRLYLNNGNGTFSDHTVEWGLPLGEAGTTAQASLPVGLAVSDFDHDGNLDVLLLSAEPQRIHSTLTVNKVPPADACEPAARTLVDSLEPAPSATMLLRNTGGRFENATDRLGVDPSRISAAAAHFVDLDGDGWDDLVISGDSCTSKLLLNSHGAFVDRTAGSGVDLVPQATGIGVVDADHDGRLDLFLGGAWYRAASGRCTNPLRGYACSPNHLLIAKPDGGYADHAADFGVRASGWTWGVGVADLNNDSFEDLFTTTGIRSAGMLSQRSGSKDAARFDWNHTDDRAWGGAADAPFRHIDREAFSPADVLAARGRAVIGADFDRDGRMDLLVVNSSGRPALLMNTTANGNHWLGIELRDERSHNRAAVGAMVSLTLPDGRALIRQVGVEQSYQGGGPAAVHFGLGDLATVAEVTVRWPDGSVDRIGQPRVDEWNTVSRGPKGRRD